MSLRPPIINIFSQRSEDRERLASILQRRGEIRPLATTPSAGSRPCIDEDADLVLVDARPYEPARIEPLLRDILGGGQVVPVVALTSPGDAAACRAAFLAGAADCLDFPDVGQDGAPLVTACTRLIASASGPGGECGRGGSNRRVSNGPAAAPGSASSRCGPADAPHLFLDALTRMRAAGMRHGAPVCVIRLAADGPERAAPAVAAPASGPIADRMAKAIAGICRSEDAWTRYSHNQFILGLFGAREADGESVVDRFRRSIAEFDATAGISRTAHRSKSEPALRFSAGVAAGGPADVESEHELIKRAGLALRFAQRQGGARTAVWSSVVRDANVQAELNNAAWADVSLWVGRIRRQLQSAQRESTAALVAAVEAKDPFTTRHSEKVATHVERIARRLGLPARRIERLRVAAVLHDVGKLGVPDAILQKPGPLTEDEFEVIRRHPTTGVEILRHISHLSTDLPTILYHHERWDGQGYPAGLEKDGIPFGARILAAADAIDAMLSRRSYKTAFEPSRVIEELRRGSGCQFDPTVADAAVAYLTEENPENEAREDG